MIRVEKLNIEVELCGYRARITHIGVIEAYPPWRPDDALCAHIAFNYGHPENILATAIIIPTKEYSHEELLVVVKREGEKQVATMIAKRIKDSEDNALRQRRREELNALAKRAEALLAE